MRKTNYKKVNGFFFNLSKILANAICEEQRTLTYVAN